MSSLDRGQYGRIIGGIIELIASNGYSDGNGSDTWCAKSKNGWHLLQRPTVSVSLDFHSNWLTHECWLYISLSVWLYRSHFFVPTSDLMWRRVHGLVSSEGSKGSFWNFTKWETRIRGVSSTLSFRGCSGWYVFSEDEGVAYTDRARKPVHAHAQLDYVVESDNCLCPSKPSSFHPHNKTRSISTPSSSLLLAFSIDLWAHRV